MNEKRWLFSYGTLRQPQVQQEVFGREVETVEDSLPGFSVEMLRITEPKVISVSKSDQHPILRRGKLCEHVHGVALAVTEDDLAKADLYEVSDYVRIQVYLISGRAAAVYVHRDDH